MQRSPPERFLQSLGVAVGLGCWSLPLSLVGETVRSPVHGFIVAVVCAFAALYGSASSRWLDRKEWGNWPRSLIRGLQLVAPFLVVAGWPLLVFHNAGGVLAVVALSALVWWVSADVARVLSRSRGVEGAEGGMGGTRSNPLRRLATRFLLGGVLLTRPGGSLCLWESDCDAHAMLASDLGLSRRLMRFVGDHEFNGAVGCQLIGWLKELGWQVEVIPAVPLSDGSGFLTNWLLDEWIADAVEASVVTPAEAEDFLAEMRHRQANHQFFSYIVNFRITARKPGE